jgi:hypothetical protein
MPTLVEINGIDEAGKFGDPIYFVRIGVRIDEEVNLLLRNLDYFGKLLVRKEDLYGRDEKNLQKYLSDSIDDPCTDVSFFRMSIETQMSLIHDYLSFQAKDIFNARRILIDTYDSMAKNPNEQPNETAQKDFWSVIQFLKMFGQFPFLYESVVKSYGMMNITAKMDKMSNLFRSKLVEGARHMLVVQADGGYPFVFWLHRFLDNCSKFANIKKGNISISGIAHGDSYYPAISTAGSLAYVLNKYPQRAFMFPITELKYDEDYTLTQEYYSSHAESVYRRTFANRLLFIGSIDPDLKSVLPYCLHRNDRKKTFEPFHIEKNVKSFFDEHTQGRVTDNIVVMGKLATSQQKFDAKFCKDKGFVCYHIEDFQNEISNLLQDVEDEIDILHKDKKTKLSAIFEPIKKRCNSQLK